MPDNDAKSVNITAIGWRNWLLAFAGWLCCALLLAAVYMRIANPELRLHSKIITHGNGQQANIALTFDDGPHPLWTPLIADTLERHGARGTFFLVAQEAYLYPEITARLAAHGHQIGNHSLTHPLPNLTYCDNAQVSDEIIRAQRVLQQLSGQKVSDFRPPGGGVDARVLAVLQQQNMRMAWWSANIGDWNSPPTNVILARLQAAQRPGQIILLHSRGNTLPALEEFFRTGQQSNFHFCTLSEINNKLFSPSPPINLRKSDVQL